jgi:signal peptide peptidase SppA
MPTTEAAKSSLGPDLDGLLAHLAAIPWAMEPKALTAFIRSLGFAAQRALADAEQVRGARAAAQQPRVGARDEGDTAIVPISGPILKRGNWVLDYFGIGYTSTLAVGAALREISARPEITRIVLLVDSPGGTVEGTQELADQIAGLAKTANVVAYVSDTAASGAYWLASQTKRIEANDTALVGSIGVYSVLVDWSRLYDNEGVKVNVIRSAPLKGAGYPGDKVTDAQLADEQRVVDALAAKFTEAVARGRGLDPDQARAVSVGTVWLAEEAKARGLVDGVSNWAEFLPRVAAGASARTPSQEVSTMPGDAKDTGPKPYTAGELRAAYPEQVAALCKEAAADATRAERERCAAVLKAQVGRSDEQAALALAAVEKGHDVAEATDAMKSAELARLRASGAPPVGPSAPAAPAAAEGDGDAKLKAQWDGSAELRAEFGGEFDTFVAYTKADRAGRIRHGKRTED